MNNPSKKLILILILGILLIGAILIYFFVSSPEAKVLEINFVSNCTVCTQNELAPEKITLFSDVYSDDENDVIYFSKTSFKRLDLDRMTDTLGFSKPIDEFSNSEEMSEMFLQERNNRPATEGMYVNAPKSQNKSIEDETKLVKHFYLVCAGSESKVDNMVYFNSPEVLKQRIIDEIKSGRLNENGFKPNTIVIVLDCCGNEVNNDIDSPQQTETRETRETTENGKKDDNQSDVSDLPKKNYSGNIKQNGNTISWNADLATADQLTIIFKSDVDGKVLVSENVTGKSSFYFSYSNSIYEGSKIKVSLTGTWKNGSKISNSASLVTTTLECH